MSNKKTAAEKIETLSTIIVNIGTIVSWGLTAFTAFVLTSQPQPIALPGFIELNAWYKLLFFTSILLGYIQVLKTSWEGQKRTTKGNIEGSFGSYLFGSIVKFKRPLIFIGFLIILTLIGTIVFTEIIGLGVAIIFVLFFSSFAFFSLDGWSATKRQFDDDFRKRWLKRIKNQLYENGCTTTLDFVNLPLERDEINWALQMYFNYYEFEQDLVFTQRFFTPDYILIYEIRFKNVPSVLQKLVL